MSRVRWTLASTIGVLSLLIALGRGLDRRLRLAAPAGTQQIAAGFRASRILSNYAGGRFPPASYWIRTGRGLADRFDSSYPAMIWIVGLYQDHGDTLLEFPLSRPGVPHAGSLDLDEHEWYLDQFDRAGLRVWLQVEPGEASVEDLIELVLGRYHKHSCVAGFGVDVEWYDPIRSPGGRRVTDWNAERWEQRVRRYDPGYTLFLKHWDPDRLPPHYRGRILFVDDSMGHASLPSMVREFELWGRRFSPAAVAFQIGYPIDARWWRPLPDPPRAIGDAIRAAVPNTAGLFWVDFTLRELFLEERASPAAR